MTRLQLEVYPDNERAIGLYKKYGFETEGLYRAFGYRDGRYVDTLVMGRLREQSPVTRAAGTPPGEPDRRAS